ncbi:putative cellulose synthase (UDP-forming) [Helianthus annuus]|uniref:Cellulose synthase (UDP-forming) n=1 Tax=Helianthus annuus TaxID=4232 RepID=A0A251U7L7_HELAN|nr:cellulose synthase-like protein E1 [Helianthus annuus]KAF5796351.1 putative cellulose synthase (UDP-forming) [Helianthus annuus]KAJ0539684.1 putative cellulose synthase (UDP-forming) [Helianthus annuus]KAJ0547961.1 putative cellulose synthase (UDP-forming) [Helianthus annuus]KAJ0554413.1 putative cellulose synthase (UDP-forming) [Helianthus annuus]KAJ0898946.1 putative cellulose synthase (UDP-forming) [Helianthus annuus]
MGGENSPLFETQRAKGRKLHRVFATTVLVSIIWIWVYRATQQPPSTAVSGGRSWWWTGMFMAELWLGLYWVLTQSVRWNPTYRRTFKQRLSQRYEHQLPRVDIFVCTADPKIEPPMMVVSTVLSVMAYDYPPEKLSVYLSDDGGSELTFYALTQATMFSKHWLPYCRNYKIEPRSPVAYFKSASRPSNTKHDQDHTNIKKLFEEMKDRIENVMNDGRVPDELRLEHEGFTEWDSFTSPKDHAAIVQILLDQNEDAEGKSLPKLVYLAREKRPDHFHNFKAGAMNALIRISSKISNGPIILNVDCDMYSNNSDTVRDALCFFVDEEKGHEIAFVQYPQCFENVTKNEVYGGSMRVLREVDFHGLDGNGGPLYVGTGCFHRRDILLGKSFDGESSIDWKMENDHKETQENTTEELKNLASCTYEIDTEWGKEMGLKYGCPVEDVITGLSIHCRGWKSVFYNPKREAFLGVSATTLDQTLVQHKRWSEGDLLILLSKYSPAWYGLGKVNPGLIMSYLIYCLWSPSSVPTVYYSIVPSLCLLKGVPLFPAVTSGWFLPFAYIIVTITAFDYLEFLRCGGTTKGWWNDRRIWLYKRTSSYLFALLDTILGSDLSFVISSKVMDNDVQARYEKEMMEFGVSSPLTTTVATISMLNLVCFVGVVMKSMLMDKVTRGVYYETMAVHVVLCGALVVLNMPLYRALFVRKDKGKIPDSVTVKAVVLALFISTVFYFM